MKVGFVFDDSLDKPDGVQQYILTLGSWLAIQGHDVHYLVGQTQRTDISNTHSLSRNIAVRFNKNRLTVPLPVSVVKLRTFLNEQDFDVLHVQLPYSPQFAQRVINNAPPKTALIGTFHILPFGAIQAWGTKVLSKLLASSLRRFDTIVAVSPAAQEFAKMSMGIISDVVPNAVNLKKFEIKVNKSEEISEETTIVFLGRLVQRKGCLELLRALALLKKQDKLQNVKVVIGGDGPEASRLKAFVHTNNLASVVSFKGQLKESEKAQFLSTANIVALPSLAGESFGITVVEAIAAGAGVTIGGNNPGYSFVLSQTPQALIDPHDTTKFAKLLNQLIADPHLRASLGKQQRAHIKQFDVPLVGRQMESIYAQAIQKHDKVYS